MDRRVLVSAMVVLSFALGCGRPAQEQPKPAEPAPPPPPAPTAVAPAPAPVQATPTCAVPVGDRVDIAVAQDGSVDKECVEIEKPKKVTIYWTVQPPAVSLKVTFKHDCGDGIVTEKLPKDPKCDGLACSMDAKKYEHITKKTIACYSVEVGFKEGPPATKDPRIIINP